MHDTCYEGHEHMPCALYGHFDKDACVPSRKRISEIQKISCTLLASGVHCEMLCELKKVPKTRATQATHVNSLLCPTFA